MSDGMLHPLGVLSVEEMHKRFTGKPWYKLSTPVIALTEDGPRLLAYLEDLSLVSDDTEVLVPWVGQWRTWTFKSTAKDLLDFVSQTRSAH